MLPCVSLCVHDYSLQLRPKQSVFTNAEYCLAYSEGVLELTIQLTHYWDRLVSLAWPERGQLDTYLKLCTSVTRDYG